MPRFRHFGKVLTPVLLFVAPIQAQNITPRIKMDSLKGYRTATLLKQGGVCTDIKPAHRRQELIDTLVGAWADFGYQVYDLSSRQTHAFPGGSTFNVVPNAQNKWQAPKIIPRMLRVGRWEDNRHMDVAIGSFWASLPKGGLFLSRQNQVWAVNDNAGWADAWSAAFISWSLCESGAPMADFLRHQSHYMYVDDALRGDTPLYKALDIDTAGIPELGDMICADRSKNNTYQTLKDREKHLGQARPLHCDIVVNRDLNKNRIFAIGGNVGNSVTLTALRLVNGKLEQTARRPWFAVLRWMGGGRADFGEGLKRVRE